MKDEESESLRVAKYGEWLSEGLHDGVKEDLGIVSPSKEWNKVSETMYQYFWRVVNAELPWTAKVFRYKVRRIKGPSNNWRKLHGMNMVRRPKMRRRK